MLAWGYRKQNLLKELLAYRADILCLQEVQSLLWVLWVWRCQAPAQACIHDRAPRQSGNEQEQALARLLAGALCSNALLGVLKCRAVCLEVHGVCRLPSVSWWQPRPHSLLCVAP